MQLRASSRHEAKSPPQIQQGPPTPFAPAIQPVPPVPSARVSQPSPVAPSQADAANFDSDSASSITTCSKSSTTSFSSTS